MQKLNKLLDWVKSLFKKRVKETYEEEEARLEAEFQKRMVGK